MNAFFFQFQPAPVYYMKTFGFFENINEIVIAPAPGFFGARVFLDRRVMVSELCEVCM